MRPLRSACVLSITMLFSAAQGEPQVRPSTPSSSLVHGKWPVLLASTGFSSRLRLLPAAQLATSGSIGRR